MLPTKAILKMCAPHSFQNFIVLSRTLLIEQVQEEHECQSVLQKWHTSHL